MGDTDVQLLEHDQRPRPAGSDTVSTADGTRSAQLSAWLIAAIVAVAVLGMVLRAINLFDAPIRTDEPTITMRAVAAAQGDLVPSGFGYPPFAAYLLAVVLRLSAVVDPAVLTDPYSVARVTFVVVSGIGVVLTGVLGAMLAPTRRAAWMVGLGAATAVAISYHAVRLGNHARPDQVQLVAIVGALVTMVVWDTDRRRRWLAVAGACAGLAAATKYIGGVVVLSCVGLVWSSTSRAVQARLGDTVVLGASSLGLFVVGTAGTVLTHREEFLTGFAAEFQHQAGQHLGYEPDGSAALFHLTQSLPGNWGWPLTVAALAGTIAVAVRGSRAERLVASFAVLGSLFTVASQVRFPHYVLLPLPALAVLAFILVARLYQVRATAGILALALVMVGLGITLTDDLRLGRANGAPDTQDLAGPLEEPYADELVIEAYTATGAVRQATLFSLADDPGLLDCGCVVATSSYQEERHRNRPDLYADDIAVYDAIRARGELLGQVAPGPDLPYRWSLLPQWGLRSIPLTGDIGPVGPTISVYRLPASGADV